MGLCSGDYNIVADQGATFTRTFTWNDSSGTPMNLTGYTARMQVRQRYVSTTPVLSLTSSPAAGITLGTTNGQIVVTASATVMAGISAGDYRYDLELVSGSVVTRLLMGSFSVKAEVTR